MPWGIAQYEDMRKITDALVKVNSIENQADDILI